MSTVIRLTCIVVIVASLSGCSLFRELDNEISKSPTRFVVVYNVHNNINSRYMTFPPGGWHEGEKLHDTAFNNTDNVRPSTAAAISANEFGYVTANWCGRPGFNNLCLGTSTDGESWQYGQGGPFVSVNREVDQESKPSITYFPPKNSWFVIWRNAWNRRIEIVEYTNGGTMTRPRWSRNNRQFIEIDNRLLRTSRPPTISFLDDKLVIAYLNEDRFAPLMKIVTSEDGVTFTAKTNMTSIISNKGAPYLHHDALGNLLLATTMTGSSSSSRDIKIWGSSDAQNWRVIETLSVAINGTIDAAIAGTPSELVVVYRQPISGVIIAQFGSTLSIIGERANSSASIAHGPPLLGN